MKWTKCLNFIGFVTLSFLFSLFAFASSCHAVDDISVTVSGQVNRSSNVFSNCTGDCLNDYQYLILNAPSNIGYYDFSLYIRFNGNSTPLMYLSSNLTWPTYNIYKLPFDGHSNNLLQWGGNYYFDTDFTLTLTNNVGPACPPAPSGTLSITENGSYDVTDYAEVDVSVIAEVIQGDYHDDLVAITNGIYVCAGTLLVLYFFYTIYRLIIKNSGVK